MNNVYLRSMTEADINDAYLSGFRDDDVLAFLEVDGKRLTKEDVVAFMEAGRKHNYFMYAVCLTATDKHIGNVKIGPIDLKHGTADLVTVIWDKEQWGKGRATEAIKAGNAIAFNDHGVRKLSGGIYSTNIGSINAYTKAGWVIEGRLQDHYIVDGKPVDRVIVSCFNPTSIS